MIPLILCTVLQTDPVEAALARFKSAMQRMPTYEAHLTVGSKKAKAFDADVVIDGVKRLRFEARPASGLYILSFSPSGGQREVDYRTKEYDEAPGRGNVFTIESRTSGLAKTIPLWLALSDLHRVIFRGTKMTYVGKENVGGHDCDLLRNSIKGPQGSALTEICIGQSGLVYRMYRESDGAGGHTEINWIIKDYHPLAVVSDSRFANAVPDGFMPYALPDQDLPPRIGSKPNLQGWLNPSSGKPWSRPSGKPVLFVLTTRGSTPCSKAVAAVRGWRSDLGATNTSVVVASDAASAAGASGLLWNPDRRSVQDLDAPATPMFFLLDGQGTLRNLWMGFDPENARTLHDDVVKAVAALK